MNRSEFMEAVFAKFPNVRDSGRVTRKELVQVATELNVDIPQSLTKNKIDRGVYRVHGDKVSSTVEQANVGSFVPEVDPNYVKYGHYKDIEKIVTSGLFYPVFITGPTGNGKTTMVEQACANNKREFIRVNMHSMVDEELLIGSKTLVDGNVKIVEGPVLLAMRRGAILLLDEMSAATPLATFALTNITEGKPFYFKLKNEVIHPTPGFNIIATDNTKGKGSDSGNYVGTNVMNEAFLERFAVTFEQDYPNAKTELKIIHNAMNQFNCFDEKFAENIIKWAEAIRKTYSDGGIDQTITTRRIIHIIRAYSIFKDTKKAIELCVNRFDDLTKTAFIDLFDKIADPADSNQPEGFSEVEEEF